MSETDIDPFSILNLVDSPILSDSQVRAAYRSAALLHPDKVPSSESQTAAAVFVQIQRAAGLLATELSRWCYRRYGAVGVQAMNELVAVNPFLTDTAIKRLVEREMREDAADQQDRESSTQLRMPLNLHPSPQKRPRTILFGMPHRKRYRPISPFYPRPTPVQSVALMHALQFPLGDIGHIEPKLTVETRKFSQLKLMPEVELSLSKGHNRLEINPAFDTSNQRASLQLGITHSVAQHGQIELSLKSPPRLFDWSDWLPLSSLTFSRGVASLTVGLGEVSTSFSHKLSEDGLWTNEIRCSVDTDMTIVSSRIGRTIGRRKKLLCFAKAEILLPHDEPLPPPSKFHHRLQLGLHYMINPSNTLTMWMAANENGLSFFLNFKAPSINAIFPVHLSSKHTKPSFMIAATIPFLILTASRATFLMVSRKKRKQQLLKSLTDQGRDRFEAFEALDQWAKSMKNVARSSRAIELDKRDGLIIEIAYLDIDTSSRKLIRSIDLTHVLQSAVDHSTSRLTVESIKSIVSAAPVSHHLELELEDVLHIRWRIGSVRYVGQFRVDNTIQLGCDLPLASGCVRLSSKNKKIAFHGTEPFW